MSDDTVSDETRTEPVEASRPVLRVVKGDPTPEELAALVAVVSSMGGVEAPAPRRVPEWSAPHRRLTPTFPAGPGAWRASGLPR